MLAIELLKKGENNEKENKPLGRYSAQEGRGFYTFVVAPICLWHQPASRTCRRPRAARNGCPAFTEPEGAPGASFYAFRGGDFLINPSLTTSKPLSARNPLHELHPTHYELSNRALPRGFRLMGI